ncbi:MAG TPA: dihydroorotase [Chthoniobacteraceae bacterium]|nr:dihydroorotase [Chthoniobacteraceae bacterium]
MKTTLITNGHIIDPANGVNRVGDVYIADGKIERVDFEAQDRKHLDDLEVIDATGLVVTPGLIDIHVHLREPGQSAKETIATGTQAAAAGGFTSIVCMPNTSPSVDSPSVVSWIREKAANEGVVNVYTTGAITKGLAGEELAPIGSMHKAGIVALTDDGHCVQNHELMRRALEYARMFNLPVMDHCQDYNLVGKGVMHEGYWSTVLGLPGWPSAGEEIIVQRNILLAELCGTPIHCQHMSAAGSVRLLRDARARGVKISGEICPHHIALTDESIQSFDTNFKMNPPLRAQSDVDALIAGVADGTITILASDHAPHCNYEKEVEFDFAPFGILGLETELGLFIDILVHKKKAIDLARLIELYTLNPARLLNLDRGTLSPGAVADVTLIDPDLEWTVDKNASASRSRNTPFHGWNLKGRAVRTMVGGKTVWSL